MEAAAGSAPATTLGPVVLAFDGSELAAFAIEQAACQLAPGRDALVVVAWQPGDVGFIPLEGGHLHAAAADEVERAAEQQAGRGTELARTAGFNARAVTVERAPTWKGLVDVAEDHGCDLIVIGSHQRHGLLGHLAGSVAAAAVAHSGVSVLVIHRPGSTAEGKGVAST